MADDNLMTFDHFITHWAADRPSLPAMQEDDRLQSWTELEESTARVASALTAAGLKKGDRIAWLGKNSDLYYTLFFGAARLGVVMVPVGWNWLSPNGPLSSMIPRQSCSSPGLALRMLARRSRIACRASNGF